MNNHGMLSVELNPVESFSFLFKNVWIPLNTKQKNDKFRISIIDTILFKDGIPLHWLFTSEKTGEVLKKKSERLLSFADIITALKTRSKSLKGQKEPYLSKKIANVWYIQSESVMTSYLVDEIELYDILKDTMREIVAVQIFIGGIPLKNGNGIFEHRMYHEHRTGKAKHHTFELLQPLENGYQASLFDDNTLKNEINDKRHELLRNFCNRLMRQFHDILNYKLESITFQVVFNLDFVPLIINVRFMKMLAPVDFKIIKDQVIYVGGTPPIPPVFDGDSLLPLIWLGDLEAKKEKFNSQSKKNDGNSVNLTGVTNNFVRKNELPEDSIGSPSLNAKKDLTAKDFEDMFITADNDIAEIQKFTEKIDVKKLKIPPIKRRSAVSKIKYDIDDDEALVAGLIASSHINREMNEGEESLSKKHTKFRIPVETRALRNHLNFSVQKSICRSHPSKKDIKESLMTSKSKDAINITRNTDNGVINSFNYVPLHKDKNVTKTTRPSSAPTTLRMKINESKEPETRNFPTVTARRGAGLSSKLPNSGLTCHGDYCSIEMRVLDGLSSMSNRLDDSKVFNAPNIMYFKSILLARAEATFLGFDIMTNLSDAVWRKFGNSDLQIDQVLHYFVKRHINAVVQKCTLEANKLKTKDSTDNYIEALYRKMVYAEALKNYKPSRLYFSSPVCHSCYQTYCFMDMQREEQVLRPISSVKSDVKLSKVTARQSDKLFAEEKALINDTNNSQTKEIETRNLAKTIVGQSREESGTKALDVLDRFNFFQSISSATTGGGVPLEKSLEEHEELQLQQLQQEEEECQSIHEQLLMKPNNLKIPLNTSNPSNYDKTYDKGIGSKGPEHKLEVSINRQGGSISAWVKLMSDRLEKKTIPIKDDDNNNQHHQRRQRQQRPQSANSVLYNKSSHQFQSILKHPSPVVDDEKVYVFQYVDDDKRSKQQQPPSDYAYSSLPYTSAPLISSHTNTNKNKTVRLSEEEYEQQQLEKNNSFNYKKYSSVTFPNHDNEGYSHPDDLEVSGEYSSSNSPMMLLSPSPNGLYPWDKQGGV